MHSLLHLSLFTYHALPHYTPSLSAQPPPSSLYLFLHSTINQILVLFISAFNIFLSSRILHNRNTLTLSLSSIHLSTSFQTISIPIYILSHLPSKLIIYLLFTLTSTPFNLSLFLFINFGTSFHNLILCSQYIFLCSLFPRNCSLYHIILPPSIWFSFFSLL